MTRKFLLILIVLFLSPWPTYGFAVNNVFCNVTHTLRSGDVKIKSSYHFAMNDGKGIIVHNGSIHTSNNTYPISREIHFTYKIHGQYGYIFSSDYVRKNPIDKTPDTLLQKHYPDFFIEKGETLFFRIHPIRVNSFIITYVNTPLFYCNGE